MFDIGWTELVLIGIVALIVIGPKDLPEMFRQLGRFTAKLKSMSREFTRAMEAAANEAGVKDVAKDINKIASPTGLGLNTVKDAADRFEKWDPLKNAAKPTVPQEPAKKITFGATPGSHDAAKPAAVDTAEAAVVVPKPEHGPATQALMDKQAAKQAILKETAEKLKAVGAAPASAEAAAGTATETAAKPARKPRAKAESPAPDAAAQPAAPRAPRKKKAPEA